MTKLTKLSNGSYTFANWNIKKTAPGCWVFHRKGETSLHVAETRAQAVAIIKEIRSTTFIERTNLMSGEKYLEREDTPFCCSPSSETYWSM